MIQANVTNRVGWNGPRERDPVKAGLGSYKDLQQILRQKFLELG
jgi:hypothetical protein